MGAFLCWLGVRVLEMHRILKPTGSLYLHIDHTAGAWVKAMLDAVFTPKNFRNEIVWKRTNAPTASRNQFGCVHDTIYAYAKSPAFTLNPVYIPYSDQYLQAHFRYKDARGIYRPTPITAQGIRHGSSGLPWRGVDIAAKGLHWVCPTALPTGVVPPPEYGAWSTQAKLDWLDSKNLIHWPAQGESPHFKRYLSTTEGTRVSDMIVDIAGLQGASKERTGYPTQKPLALYERIIKASSNEGDVVLDPFAGCATTCVAAERLGREWIGIDLNAPARDVLLERLQKETKASLAWNAIVQVYTEPPARTDDGQEAAPELTLISSRPKTPRLTARQLRERLVLADGMKCQGCGWVPHHEEYLEVDHRIPKSREGSEDIRNRVLLCSPCNGAKGNRLTLAELRQLRLNEARMADPAWNAAWYQRTGRFG